MNAIAAILLSLAQVNDATVVVGIPIPHAVEGLATVFILVRVDDKIPRAIVGIDVTTIVGGVVVWWLPIAAPGPAPGS